jgi:hypothetical protein
LHKLTIERTGKEQPRFLCGATVCSRTRAVVPTHLSAIRLQHCRLHPHLSLSLSLSLSLKQPILRSHLGQQVRQCRRKVDKKNKKKDAVVCSGWGGRGAGGWSELGRTVEVHPGVLARWSNIREEVREMASSEMVQLLLPSRLLPSLTHAVSHPATHTLSLTSHSPRPHV